MKYFLLCPVDVAYNNHELLNDIAVDIMKINLHLNNVFGYNVKVDSTYFAYIDDCQMVKDQELIRRASLKRVMNNLVGTTFIFYDMWPRSSLIDEIEDELMKRNRYMVFLPKLS